MAKINKDQLIKLQKKLKTDDAIGQEFGITRQAVHQLRQRYGIESLNVHNPERNNEILRLYNDGTSADKLSKKYNLSLSQTHRIISETKQKPSKKKK